MGGKTSRYRIPLSQEGGRLCPIVPIPVGERSALAPNGIYDHGDVLVLINRRAFANELYINPLEMHN